MFFTLAPMPLRFPQEFTAASERNFQTLDFLNFNEYPEFHKGPQSRAVLQRVVLLPGDPSDLGSILTPDSVLVGLTPSPCDPVGFPRMLGFPPHLRKVQIGGIIGPSVTAGS